MITLQDYLAQVEIRKLEIGMRETDADIQAMRNRGDNRTQVKRALLTSVEARARAAGVTPVVSFY
ncbi:MAG: hypothetical protein ACRYG8_30695 [Janthinobacterium lividum]